MLSNIKKSDNKGFTIIEVMIVLAIAGLIILIVFLAVPALQRNARNTARRTDAGRIASSVNNFVTNNNGKLPTVTVGGGSTTDAASILTDAGTLGQYTLSAGTAVAPNTFTITTGTQAALTTADAVQLVEGATCSGAGTTTGSAKQMALEYTLEGGGGTIGACENI